MSANKYIRAWIDRKEIDLYPPETNPFSINYKLEDAEDFQLKTSSDALDQTFPATPNNDKNWNTFHDPGIEDFTPNQTYRSVRSGLISVRGYEIIVGKWLLVSASHGSCPLEYEADLYGNNADWIIALKDSTLYDFLKPVNFTFTTANIISSWAFDGTDEELPYVYAPVRYGGAMNGLAGTTYPADLTDVTLDINCTPEYLKPSISPYWIMYWAFKSLGYKIKSTFFDSDFFRRKVMPWTWGAFLVTDGTRLDVLKMLAKSAVTTGYWFEKPQNNYVDLKVTNVSTDGAFDNGVIGGTPLYSYDPVACEMKWTYPASLAFGVLRTTMKCTIGYNCTVRGGGNSECNVSWYKNGVEDPTLRQQLYHVNVGIGSNVAAGLTDSFATFTVNPGDVISCKIFLIIGSSTFYGSGNCVMWIEGFDYEYSTIPQGGLIDFQNYTAWQNYSFLDLLRGLTDSFNLIYQTDPINKIVYIEPEYPYSLNNDLGTKSGGYFNGNFLNWDKKQDLKQKSTVALYSDYSRQLNYVFRNDGADGMLKLMQDRYTTILGEGIYVLPDRFQTDIKQIENRFFSPVMHYQVAQWAYITGQAPQMIVMVPENISNTSASEAQNTFQPKLAHYKGNITGAGGWMFNKGVSESFPFMFAVNYNDGGQDDPILSYSDEKIGSVSPVVGKGLLKRFYWQRMAIIRNGQYYTTWFKLNNLDVMNWLHREFISCRGQKWQLTEINDYTPGVEKSTSVLMRKWAPISPVDDANTYPSANNVLNGTISSSGYETKYYPMLAFASDIPTPAAPVDTNGVLLPALQFSFSLAMVAEIIAAHNTFIFDDGGTIYVDWGEGNPPEAITVPAGSPVSLNHVYASAADRTVNVYFDNTVLNLVSIVFQNSTMTSIGGLAGATELIQLALNNNSFATFDPGTLPPSCYDIEFENNLLTGFNGVAIPAICKDLYLYGNKLPVSVINTILETLDANGVHNGQGTVAGQTPAATPTGGGITAKANIIAKGWTTFSTD